PSTAPLTVNHQGQFPSVTLSFNLAPGVALGDAVTTIERAAHDLGLPASIRASFQGTAQAFQASLANEPLLILAALVTVYIPLGITIVGGLLVSQLLTLYTTPVVYLYLDRFRLWFARARVRALRARIAAARSGP